MMGWDVFSDWAYEGGAFCLYGGMSWALQMGAERARLAGDVAAYTAMLAAAKSLPLNEERMAWPAVLQRYSPLHALRRLDRQPGAGRLLGSHLTKGGACRSHCRRADAPCRRVVRQDARRHARRLAGNGRVARAATAGRRTVGTYSVGAPRRHRGFRARGVEPDRCRAAALVRPLPEGPGQRHRARAAGTAVRCRREGVARLHALAGAAGASLASVERRACSRAQRRRSARSRAAGASEPRRAGARSVAAGAVAGRP